MVTAFLKASVPLSKIDCFCQLLEEDAFSLASCQRELIPLIHKDEEDKIKEEICGKCISVIFDGTTQVAEAMVVVVQFVDEQWKIQQRVVRLMLLAKSLTGKEVP